MRGVGKETEFSKRLKAYIAITALLVVVAALSFLLVPQGNSIGSCERLVFESSRYACISSLALAESNASICGYAGTSSDSCYMQLAEKTNNASVCGSIKNSTTLSLCVFAIATANGNYALCSQAGQPYASRCQAEIAVRLGNATLCSGIGGAAYGAICSSIIGIRKAQLSLNPAYCLNVSSSTNKTLTNYVIANVSSGAGSAYTQNSFISSSLSLVPNVTYTARDYCYISLATRLSNPLLCANVSAGEAATLCADESSAYSANATVNYTQMLNNCAQSGSYAQECADAVIMAEAVHTRNATACARLTNGLDTSCYSLLASTYKNATYCAYISNSSAKSSCVSGS
jgi:hypothetical protein